MFSTSINQQNGHHSYLFSSWFYETGKGPSNLLNNGKSFHIVKYPSYTSAMWTSLTKCKTRYVLPHLTRVFVTLSDITHLWGLIFYASVYTPTLIIPVRARGVCSLVKRETLLELRSELRSDALPATTIDFSGIRTHGSLRANRVF